jgi:cyclopropane fatty-acyl-phospholipid synthase-like methyltransferase
MATLTPPRITAAVEMLAVQTHDHLLEIGCGNGAAAALVCERLGDGRLVAIDRSEKQISLASQRNRTHLESGKLTLHVMALESAALGDSQFDKIFAINVNSFWLRYEKPLVAIERLLKPDGIFFIFYQQPTTAKMRQVSSVLRNNLVRSGFVIKNEKASEQMYCLSSSLPANVAFRSA